MPLVTHPSNPSRSEALRRPMSLLVPTRTSLPCVGCQERRIERIAMQLGQTTRHVWGIFCKYLIANKLMIRYAIDAVVAAGIREIGSVINPETGAEICQA